MEMFFVYVEDILAVPEYLDLRRSPDYIINMFIGLPKVAPANAGNAGDVGSIPGLGRSPGEGKSYPLCYSGLKNSMDCVVHGVAKGGTQLSDFYTQSNACSSSLLIFY